MQYFIMLLIVIMLALSDIMTGWIKAHIKNDYCSAVMRVGGLRKLAEIGVMLTVCGFEMGMELLGKYYSAESLAEFAGALTAISVFIYITFMELISILENYAEIEPNAEWVQQFIKKLRNFKK
ncbi:MAG: phage holin family protein [Oscillospiraceae bacterium]